MTQTDPPAAPNSDAQPVAPSAPPAKKPRRFSVRAIAAGLCLVLATLLLPIGMTTFWAQKTLTNTEQFVDTLGPLIDDPAVVDSIAQTVTDALIKDVDLEATVAEYLPPVAKPLAGAIAAAIPSLIDQITVKVLSSEQFRTLWYKSLGTLQVAVVNVLDGNPTGPVSEQDGQIVLDLSDVFEIVKQKLAEQGITALADKPLPPAADRQIVLMDAPQVEQAQQIYAITRPAAALLLFVSLALFLGAIAISRRRVRMVGIVGAGIVIGAGLLRIFLAIAPEQVTNSFTGTPFESSAAIFFNQLTEYLSSATSFFIMIGIIAILAGWLFSNQQYAVKLRDKVGNKPANTA